MRQALLIGVALAGVVGAITAAWIAASGWAAVVVLAYGAQLWGLVASAIGLRATWAAHPDRPALAGTIAQSVAETLKKLLGQAGRPPGPVAVEGTSAMVLSMRADVEVLPDYSDESLDDAIRRLNREVFQAKSLAETANTRHDQMSDTLNNVAKDLRDTIHQEVAQLEARMRRDDAAAVPLAWIGLWVVVGGTVLQLVHDLAV